jgi:hypothetical protein
VTMLWAMLSSCMPVSHTRLASPRIDQPVDGLERPNGHPGNIHPKITSIGVRRSASEGPSAPERDLRLNRPSAGRSTGTTSILTKHQRV